jgi:predicted signal transduction protein with EAL and GGDEF domain
MANFNKKWFIIILIYLFPLFFNWAVRSDGLIWLIYIFPSIWLPFYFGLKGGLIAAATGTVIHLTNEITFTAVSHDGNYMFDIWSISIITLLNITVALTIGRLVDKLRSEQHSLQRAIAKMEYIAYHDYLTGLPNRWNFEIKLKAALEHAKHKKSQLVVLFLDLDRFKLINDSLGHAVGDEFILYLSGTTSKQEVEVLFHQSIN